MKLTLKEPVERCTEDGKILATISELNFRDRLTAGDFRGLRVSSLGPEMMVDDMLRLASRLCAQPDDVLNKLGMIDLDAVTNTIMGFRLAGREIGATRSQS